MCGESSKGVLDDVEKLNECLMTAIFSKKTVKIILTFFRKLIIFAFKNMFPRASSVIVPILKAFLPKICKKKEGCDHPLLSSYPCNKTIRVSFIDYFGLGECVKVRDYMCPNNTDNNDEIVPKLMNTVVCILKMLPSMDVKSILRRFLCRVMSMLIGYLRTQNIGESLQPIFDALHALGNCGSNQPIDPKAEKRILRDLQFRLALVDVKVR